MGAGGAADTSIAKYAELNVTNEDATRAHVRATSTVDGAQVDVTQYAFPANGSHVLSLGLPKAGNVEVLVQHLDAGKELRFTLAAGSCSRAVIDVALADGQPTSRGIACT